MMGRFKSGQTSKNKDLWKEAGGRENIVKSLISHKVNVNTDQWSSVTLALFKKDKENLQKWLKVIWQQDRQGVRTEVLQKGTLPNTVYVVGRILTVQDHKKGC